jgi:hypothetical protein
LGAKEKFSTSDIVGDIAAVHVYGHVVEWWIRGISEGLLVVYSLVSQRKRSGGRGKESQVEEREGEKLWLRIFYSHIESSKIASTVFVRPLKF